MLHHPTAIIAAAITGTASAQSLDGNTEVSARPIPGVTQPQDANEPDANAPDADAQESPKTVPDVEPIVPDPARAEFSGSFIRFAAAIVPVAHTPSDARPDSEPGSPGRSETGAPVSAELGSILSRFGSQLIRALPLPAFDTDTPAWSEVVRSR